MTRKVQFMPKLIPREWCLLSSICLHLYVCVHFVLIYFVNVKYFLYFIYKVIATLHIQRLCLQLLITMYLFIKTAFFCIATIQ
jgi:hypothetical protein